MSIPRWQQTKKKSNRRFERYWDKLIAFIAIANLSWLIFDISYIPFRGFWQTRTIYLFNSPSNAIKLKWIPDFSTSYDQIKGINKQALFEDLSLKFLNLDL